MPEPSRLYRRITESNLPTRVIAHLSVVSLVVIASLVGFTSTQGHDGAGPSEDRDFLSLVSSVRGAAAPTQELTTTSYDVNALYEEQSTLVDRGMSAGRPDEPMPTPVPVDPDATPLPGPSTGSTATAGVPSTRVARPAASGSLCGRSRAARSASTTTPDTWPSTLPPRTGRRSSPPRAAR